MSSEPDAKLMTVEEWLLYDVPEGLHAELVDGELVMNPLANWRHQQIVRRLVSQVEGFIEDDLDFARRVADHIALAISHQGLAEAVRRDAESRETAARLEAQVATLTRELAARTGQPRVVGRSKQWRDVLAHAARVARTETTVLLTGESGTGKEVVARFIHHASRRSHGLGDGPRVSPAPARGIAGGGQSSREPGDRTGTGLRKQTDPRGAAGEFLTSGA